MKKVITWSSVDPETCRAGGKNALGSGDHLFISLYDYDGSFLWAVPNEVYSANYNQTYWTPGASVSCEAYDSSYVQNRNVSHVVEQMHSIYQINY